jgi:8-oxo-dGTP pyrophosphatase MutT (NUDIX family)
MDKTAIRDAATIIIVRHAQDNPSILMGQRGKGAVFMPGKFVFPGGAVDHADHHQHGTAMTEPHASRLAEESNLPSAAIASAAIRELWEETGQILGQTGTWSTPPKGWRGFAARGYVPNLAALSFFFRAVTPEGRPRRFDARFLLAKAEDLVTDPDNFAGAEDELSHIQWVPLDAARQFPLAFITQVVLSELQHHLNSGQPIGPVPFVRNDNMDHAITRLAGNS